MFLVVETSVYKWFKDGVIAFADTTLPSLNYHLLMRFKCKAVACL